MISLEAYGFLGMIVGIIMCVAGLLGGDVYFGVLGLGGAIVGHRAWKLRAFENLLHDVLFWAAGDGMVLFLIILGSSSQQ